MDEHCVTSCLDIVRRYSQFIIHYFHARGGLNNEAIHKYALSSGIIKTY